MRSNQLLIFYLSFICFFASCKSQFYIYPDRDRFLKDIVDDGNMRLTDYVVVKVKGNGNSAISEYAISNSKLRNLIENDTYSTDSEYQCRSFDSVIIKDCVIVLSTELQDSLEGNKIIDSIYDRFSKRTLSSIRREFLHEGHFSTRIDVAQFNALIKFFYVKKINVYIEDISGDVRVATTD